MSKSKDVDTRYSVASGTHYPKDPTELRNSLNQAFQDAFTQEIADLNAKAIIVPSVGYELGLPVSAKAYSSLIDQAVDEIFLFSDPVLHELDFMAFSDKTYWETPLGKIELSHRINRIVHADDSLKDLMKFDESKHGGEASLEIQLPYATTIWQSTIRLIPFMMGEVSPRLAADTLDKHVDQDDLLICVTNLSPGVPKDYAEEIDRKTLEAIEKKDIDYLESDAYQVSAKNSLKLVTTIAQNRGWKARVLEYKHVEENKDNTPINLGLASLVFYA